MTNATTSNACPTCDIRKSWDAMLIALRFALPYMEDLANSSDNADEHHAAQLMRDAIAIASSPLGG